MSTVLHCVHCRYDWHQTASHVTVAVYAKKYDPERSYLEVRLYLLTCNVTVLPTQLSPVRLVIHLVFPAENNNTFHLDIQLKGVVEVTIFSPSSPPLLLG